MSEYNPLIAACLGGLIGASLAVIAMSIVRMCDDYVPSSDVEAMKRAYEREIASLHAAIDRMADAESN